MKLSRKKFAAFAVLAVALSVTVMLVLLLAADLILHRRAERSAGLNRYGYRGPVVGGKAPGELRVVMVGGSTVFGYGVAWDESLPFYLEARLRERLQRPVSVVNLGYNNEGANAFVPNLEDFEDLDYDVVVFYEGYNDLPGDISVNAAVYRRQSALYRLTGYYPILPLYLRERAQLLRHGDIGTAYKTEAGEEVKTVFRPNVAQRTTAAALETLNAMTQMLESQLGKVAAESSKPAGPQSALGCTAPWLNFCEAVAAGVRFARARGAAAVVVGQPALVAPQADVSHVRQLEMLSGMLARTFGNDPGVVWTDQSKTVDLHSLEVTFDSMHLKPDANRQLADALVDPVLLAATRAGVHK